jgi:hypothetical protein
LNQLRFIARDPILTGILKVTKLPVQSTFWRFVKPTTLLSMFNTPQLEGVAQDVEDTIVKIMKEAASGTLRP